MSATIPTMLGQSAALSESCPKFNSCSAAYCPASGTGKHRKGKAVCTYLLEAVKPNGEAVLNGSLVSDLAGVLLREGVRLKSTAGTLQNRLQRASRQGSKMVWGCSLNTEAA